MGNADLTIESLTFTPESSPDFAFPDPGLPLLVPPAGSVDVEILFVPTTEALITAFLKIGSNDASDPLLEVSFSGTGVSIGPRQMLLDLESLLSDLINIVSDDKKTSKDLERAIRHVFKSLEPDLWLDDFHVNDKKVFDELKKAAKDLTHVIDSKNASDEVKDVSQIIIEDLVNVSGLLAEAAVEDAEDARDEIVDDRIRAKMNKEIDKSVDEFEKVANELDETKKRGPNYEKAIDHNKHAWKHAQHALDKAFGPPARPRGKK